MARRRKSGLEYLPDTGCNLAPSCLQCPLPACKYDDPTSPQQHRHTRDQSILKLQRETGLSVPDLARYLQMSVRSVYRILTRAMEEEET